MTFCSFTFLLLFLPAVLLLHRLLPEKAKRPFLLLASLVFYGWGGPVYLLLLFFIMLTDWLGALIMEKTGRARKLTFIIIIILNLLPLFFFKYIGLLRDTVNALLGLEWSFADPLLPAGISFFTFQGMSYVIDVYRRKVGLQKNLMVFGVYLSLFPQLVAGPIVRYSDIEEQLLHPVPVSDRQVLSGMKRFCTGLAKKILLADSCGRLVSMVQADYAAAGTVGTWLALIAFSFEIFFDFAGYSDMALGIGKALGFTFNENFDRPYRAVSLTDFWRRWHMSLTTWFKEYVYIPLGGSHKGTARRDLNIMIVWALTGLWHGAGWNFVLWGVWFGVLLILEKRLLLNRKWYERIPSVIRRLLTYLFVLAGWSIFMGGDKGMYISLAGMNGAGSPDVLRQALCMLPLLILCGCISFLPAPKKEWLQKPAVIRAGAVCAAVLFALSLCFLCAKGYSPFVYFKF
ncbi:MAG: transcriptional regulator [Clostridiales bacterium]|nr:transcriptional regulator [Clostridiales bacterium]